MHWNKDFFLLFYLFNGCKTIFHKKNWCEPWTLKDREILMISLNLGSYLLNLQRERYTCKSHFYTVSTFKVCIRHLLRRNLCWVPTWIVFSEFFNDTFPPPSLIFLWWSFTFPLMKSFQRKIGVSKIKHWQVERESRLDLRLSRNWLTHRLRVKA